MSEINPYRIHYTRGFDRPPIYQVDLIEAYSAEDALTQFKLRAKAEGVDAHSVTIEPGTLDCSYCGKPLKHLRRGLYGGQAKCSACNVLYALPLSDKREA